MLINLEQIKKTIKDENIIPVAKEFSADTISPVAAFMRLSAIDDQAFFFESIEGGEKIGRYCFLGISPFETIKVNNNEITIENEEIKKIETNEPFKIVKEHIQSYKSLKFKELPPFCGGAIGYIGFDSVHYFEDLPFVRNIEKEETFKPIDDILLMLFDTIVCFDNLFNKIIIISNINLNKNNLENGYNKALESIEKTKKQLFKPVASEQPFEIKPIDIDSFEYSGFAGQEYFENSVKKIKSYIREGDIFQCVISEQFSAKLTAQPFEIYRALRTISPSPYMFYISMGKNILLGASPETLVKVENNIVSTCPIAGTRPRGKTEKADKKLEKELLASVKEKAEHLMLVDLGRNDVGRVSKPGTVNVDEFMQVYRFSNVMHLVSLVSGKLKKGISALDALESCFPAGTLSGAPKIRALEIIQELELANRGAYGGAVIYFDFSGSLDSCITIRSLMIQGDTGYWQAGAGIVADSKPIKEYEEVLHKAKSIVKAITLAQGE